MVDKFSSKVDCGLRAMAIFDERIHFSYRVLGAWPRGARFRLPARVGLTFIYSMPYSWMPGPSSKSNAASLMPVVPFHDVLTCFRKSTAQ